MQYTFTSLFPTIHVPWFGVDLEPAKISISDAKEPCQLTGWTNSVTFQASMSLYWFIYNRMNTNTKLTTTTYDQKENFLNKAVARYCHPGNVVVCGVYVILNKMLLAT